MVNRLGTTASVSDGRRRPVGAISALRAADTAFMLSSTENAKSRKLVLRFFLFVLLLLPAVYLVSLVAKYGVNVPYADEFGEAPLLVKAHSQPLTFSDLFRQHNEHRYVFTRLILIAFAELAHGNLRAEMFFSAVLAGLCAINLWIILRRTIPASIEKALVLSFLLNLLLFSPVQVENWMWGFQFVPLFCNWLFTSALVIATSDLSVWKKFALCLGLAFGATFSFGVGMLLWPLTFPLALLIQPGMRWKSRIGWSFAWAAACLATVALYFIHYVKPGSHPVIAASRNPLDYFLYITTFLGAHLSRADRTEQIFQAAVVGFVLLAVWGFGLAYAFHYRRDLDFRRRTLPWLALGSYAVSNAVLAAAARIGFGINQALDSRYTSFSLYLSVAAIGLFVILKRDLSSRFQSRAFESAAVRLETILLTAFGVLSLVSFSWGRSAMIESHRTRLLGKGALLFSNVIDSAEVHDRCLMADASYARACANLLDGMGLMHPRMLRTAEISKLNPKAAADIGYLDYISTTGSACKVVGWAILPKTGRAAHCVVLSYEDPQRGAIAFRVADERRDRPDVAAVLNNPEAEASGWACHFDRSILPPGNLVLRAWAFDANHAVLYPLGTPKILQ